MKGISKETLLKLLGSRDPIPDARSVRILQGLLAECKELDPWLPEHKMSLELTHNNHKINYDTAEKWLALFGANYDWVSEEDKQQAINLDSIWTLTIYPNTPVGSDSFAASSLEVLLDLANRINDE